MSAVIAAFALPAVVIWVYLIAAHGKFWLSRPELAPVSSVLGPRVDIVVPARDEAQNIANRVVETSAGFYKVAIIVSRETPLCRATDRRIETNVPMRSGLWFGTTIR